MYNPLALLQKEHIDTLINEGNKYFVRQTYNRGLKAGDKESFLITPYMKLKDAQEHIMAIILESRTAIYDITNPDHRVRLYTAASQVKGYSVYLNRLRESAWHPPRKLQMQIHDYVKMLGWGSRNMNIDAKLGFKNGKLVIDFTNNGITESASLDELEKI